MTGPRTRTTLQAVSAGVTDVGRRREHNEDTVLVAPELELYGVCDGVGGHSRGDVASALAAVTLESFFRDERSAADRLSGMEDLSTGARRLLAAVHEANAAVFREGGGRPQSESMGSTVVVTHFAVDEGLIHTCHVGDSRCYRFRDGELEQLTRDHNVRNDALLLDPSLTEDFLAGLPKHVVTRALGHAEEVEPDIRSDESRPGDLYLLCSDGLCGLVPDVQITEVLVLIDDLEVACDELVVMANAAGGVDNISAVLVRIEAIDDEWAELAPLADPDLSPCTQCGAPWVRDTSFCVGCGTPLAAPNDDELVEASCAQCSAELLADTSFCVECGAPHGAYD